MTKDRQKKIALIGATGYEYVSHEVRVECFAWNRIKKVANLADYDIVILDLLPIDDVKRLDSAAFRSILNVRIAQEVLGKKGSSIFVLGDPRFSVEWQSHGDIHSEPFLAWTGIEFMWDDRPGDTVERSYEASKGPFKVFADKLTRWSYSLLECRPCDDEYAKVWNVEAMREQGEHPAIVVNEICENSYGNALVFSVIHAVERRADHYHSARRAKKETVPMSNPILFLPESEFSEEEALEFVLRDLCGVAVSAPEPEWITDLVAPGQEEVDREINELEERIRELVDEQDRKIEELAEVREPLRLLYETGAALEESVRSVLKALGAEVEWPEDRTSEDGWITVRVGDEILEGVLEIKGVKGKYFDFQGLRQLTDWIFRGISLRKKAYTGIFVGNSSREDPPRRREWPFSKNWVEQAELFGYAAIRTEDLYILYLLDRTGRLDRDEFWRGLFSTKGPYNMRAYRKQLTDEEAQRFENIPQT